MKQRAWRRNEKVKHEPQHMNDRSPLRLIWLGQIRRWCSIGQHGSLRLDSCRAGRMPGYGRSGPAADVPKLPPLAQKAGHPRVRKLAIRACEGVALCSSQCATELWRTVMRYKT